MAESAGQCGRRAGNEYHSNDNRGLHDCREYFGNGSGLQTSDQVGFLDGGVARFGRSYIGEPDVIAEELARDAAVREADTLLLTVPNQLGVAYNTRLLATIAEHVAPAVGWQPAPRP